MPDRPHQSLSDASALSAPGLSPLSLMAISCPMAALYARTRPDIRKHSISATIAGMTASFIPAGLRSRIDPNRPRLRLDPTPEKAPQRPCKAIQGRRGHSTGPGRVRSARGDVCRDSCTGADIEAMHYHAWLRSGRVFTMSSRRFEIQSTAHRWATGQRPEKGDRLVLGCEACPETRPSKRRPPRWGAIARRLAARFDWPASEVREALAAELAADRDCR